MRQNREESKSKTKVVARDKPHGEEKKKETKSRKQREEVKAAEEKKERDLTLTSVMWVLKSELSHLMREASCTSFIGGA